MNSSCISPGSNSDLIPCGTNIYLVVFVALGGVVLISLAFLIAVCLYKRIKRKRSVRYVYQTNPKKKSESLAGLVGL